MAENAVFNALLERLNKILDSGKNKINPAGAKRPILDSRPVPWVGGTHPSLGEWARIDAERAEDAENGKLCIVCGIPLSSDFVYANFDGEKHDRKDRRLDTEHKTANELLEMIGGTAPIILVGAPTATFVHPRCALLAAAFCPHLKSQEFPAIAQDGTMLTAEKLRRMSNVHENKK